MDVEDQGLISPELLQVFSMTPMERRARMFPAYRVDARTKCKIRRTLHTVGGRLHIALRSFSADIVEQFDKELTKKTRQEVFHKLKFMTGGTGRAKKGGLKNVKNIEAQDCQEVHEAGHGEGDANNTTEKEEDTKTIGNKETNKADTTEEGENVGIGIHKQHIIVWGKSIILMGFTNL